MSGMSGPQQLHQHPFLKQPLLLLSGLLCSEILWADIPGRFVVAGHSMGGRVALEVIRRAPCRVSGLALLNPGIHAVRNSEALYTRNESRYYWQVIRSFKDKRTASASTSSGDCVLCGRTAKRATPRLSTTTDSLKSVQPWQQKKLRPVHPGDILCNDFLEPLGLTAYRLAKELGVSRPTVTQLVARRRNVTAEMALRLVRYFGTSAQVWQNLQAQYDLDVATTKIGKVVKQKIRPREVEATRRSVAARDSHPR